MLGNSKQNLVSIGIVSLYCCQFGYLQNFCIRIVRYIFVYVDVFSLISMQ